MGISCAICSNTRSSRHFLHPPALPVRPAPRVLARGAAPGREGPYVAQPRGAVPDGETVQPLVAQAGMMYMPECPSYVETLLSA